MQTQQYGSPKRSKPSAVHKTAVKGDAQTTPSLRSCFYFILQLQDVRFPIYVQITSLYLRASRDCLCFSNSSRESASGGGSGIVSLSGEESGGMKGVLEWDGPTKSVDIGQDP